MDRAIKFRAWSTENKKMYPVDEFTCNWNRSFITKTSELVIKSTNILMQFTGLYDCEGKEIYEEDVIEYTQHHFNTELIKVKRKIVKWNYDRWNIYETAAGETDVKLIGNIYEHPNLLNNESNT